MEHPLDKVFDIDSSKEDLIDIEKEYGIVDTAPNTEITYPVTAPGGEKDADDLIIEGKIDAIYDAALLAYEDQVSFIQAAEPRYAARNAEVAQKFLDTALQAAVARGKFKHDRMKNSAFVPFSGGGGRTTNNYISASREDILKMVDIDGSSRQV